MAKFNKFILALKNNGIKDFENYQLLSAEKDGRLKIKNLKTLEESIIHVEGKLEKEILELKSVILENGITSEESKVLEVVSSLEVLLNENKLNSDILLQESIISVEESVISLELSVISLENSIIEEKKSDEKTSKKKGNKKVEEVEVKTEETEIEANIDPALLAEEMAKVKIETESSLTSKIEAFKSDLIDEENGKKVDKDTENETEIEFI